MALQTRTRLVRPGSVFLAAVYVAHPYPDGGKAAVNRRDRGIRATYGLRWRKLRQLVEDHVLQAFDLAYDAASGIFGGYRGGQGQSQGIALSAASKAYWEGPQVLDAMRVISEMIEDPDQRCEAIVVYVRPDFHRGASA